MSQADKTAGKEGGWYRGTRLDSSHLVSEIQTAAGRNLLGPFHRVSRGSLAVYPNDQKVQESIGHDNRHTACSRWIMVGVPAIAVAKYVGHATIQMTMRYARLMPDANRQAAEKMPTFNGNTSAPPDGRKPSQSEVPCATISATGTSGKISVARKSL